MANAAETLPDLLPTAQIGQGRTLLIITRLLGRKDAAKYYERSFGFSAPNAFSIMA